MSLTNMSLFIFPHQLFEEHAGLKLEVDEIILIEDSLFFKDDQYPINFHYKKLILHRASMKAFAARLTEQQDNVRYCDWQPNLLDHLFKEAALGSKQVIISDCVDFALNKRIKQLAFAHKVELRWLKSQLFINSNEENTRYRKGKKRWFMADFYKYQRRKLNLLIDKEDKPVGGKWSFDESNRKKTPKKQQTDIPTLSFPSENRWVVEAREYVTECFPDALGCVDDFEYPVTHQDAINWLNTFLEQRFALFGPYEDALVPKQSWLYHSILTP